MSKREKIVNKKEIFYRGKVDRVFKANYVMKKIKNY